MSRRSFARKVEGVSTSSHSAFAGSFARIALLTTTSLASAGCSLPSVTLEHRPCPCAPGWTCNAGVCEPCSGGGCVDAAVLVDARGIDAWSVSDVGVDAMDAFTADDAGDPDAFAVVDGGTDGGVDAFVLADAWVPASGCEFVVPGRVWCTGFEAGESDFSGLSVGPNGSVTFTSDSAALGRTAGRTQSRTGDWGGYTFQRTGLGIGGSSGHVYVTFWMRPETPHADVDFMWIGDPGLMNHRVYLGFGPTGQLHALLGHTPNYTVGLWGDDSILPNGEWSCIELDVTVGNPGDVDIHITRSGTRTALGEVGWYMAATPVTTTPTGYPAFSIGVDWANRDISLLFDEIAIGMTPQPCSR